MTEQEFQEWKGNQVTLALFKALYNERERLKEGLVQGAYEDENNIKGRCAAVASILTISYEELMEDASE